MNATLTVRGHCVILFDNEALTSAQVLANVTLTNGGVITFSSDRNTYSYEFILWVVVLNLRNEFQCRKLLVTGAAYLTDVAFSIVSNVRTSHTLFTLS